MLDKSNLFLGWGILETDCFFTPPGSLEDGHTLGEDALGTAGLGGSAGT